MPHAQRRFLFLALVVVPATTATGHCSSDLNCSLNGLCTNGACVCDKPWGGPVCGVLQYKTTPASAKNIYNNTDPRNTWNGPIAVGSDGKYHIYDPLYNVGSLGGPPFIMHGVADKITGPWDWTTYDNVCEHCGENPAYLSFKNTSSGKMVSTLWVGGKIWVADSPEGPFALLPGAGYPGGNPAPIFHDGAFFLTNQATVEVFTTDALDKKWTKFADIAHPPMPNTTQYHTEDPFMWVDKRNNWHIINHAYDNYQYENCGTSTLSAHFYSTNGKEWHMDPDVNPYTHTVQYDDGSSHTYTTLERPNLHFDATGQLTHINLAADLVTGDEGCANRTAHSHFGHCPCDNCKWADHAGTIVIVLDA